MRGMTRACVARETTARGDRRMAFGIKTGGGGWTRTSDIGLMSRFDHHFARLGRMRWLAIHGAFSRGYGDMARERTLTKWDAFRLPTDTFTHAWPGTDTRRK